MRKHFPFPSHCVLPTVLILPLVLYQLSPLLEWKCHEKILFLTFVSPEPEKHSACSMCAQKISVGSK